MHYDMCVIVGIPKSILSMYILSDLILYLVTVSFDDIVSSSCGCLSYGTASDKRGS